MGIGIGAKGSSGAQGLFSAVTGRKRSETSGSSSGAGGHNLAIPKRAKTMPTSSSSNVTVSGAQFVWGSNNNNSQAMHADESQSHAGSNFGGGNSTAGFGSENNAFKSASKAAMSAMDARMAAPAGGLKSSQSSVEFGNGNGAKKGKKANRVALSTVGNDKKSLFKMLPN